MYAMDLNALSDLVMNGLARLDLALELNFLCIELCQKLYRSMFLMQAFHVTQFFVLFWSCDFPCIIYMKMLWLTLICGGFLILLKNSDFFYFLRHQCKLIIDIAMTCKSARASWDLGTLTLL